MVSNRSCGACVACCVVPPIRSADFFKTSGTVCVNCLATGGCAIYPARPQACRDFMCGWRSLPFLDDRWRPDRCGILVVPEEQDIPAHFARRTGLNLVAYRAPADLEAPFVIEMVAGLVHGNVPTFLSTPGPPGFHFAKALLNDRLAAAAAKRDGDAIRRALLSLHDVLQRGIFEPVET
jgi:hypothetical protein